MSTRRLLVVGIKEFRHIGRDLRLLFLVTVGPAFLLVTLAYVFALDVGQVVLAVRDADRTSVTRDLVSHIAADGDFVVGSWLHQDERAEQLFSRGAADIVLAIPRGFTEAALGGEPAQVQCIVDGVDAIAASQSVARLESRVGAFVAHIAQSRAGLGAESLAIVEALDVVDRAWYNGTLKSVFSMVPGLLAVILCMPAMALALALAREKEMGSLESLIATPVQGAEYLAGKVLAYVVSGVFGAVLAWVVATVWFRVPFRGTIAGFLILTTDYLIASMGISLVVASFVRNQQTAMFVILAVFFVPSFFLTGLFRPVAEQPVARAVAYLLPPTHFVGIARSLFLKGTTVKALWRPAAALLGIGVACQITSLSLFRKKLA
ncbi:MAG: ABC transporter permease [Anaerolineae bacterium]|jgi:ABC-2 type transport system permease protein